MIKKILLSLFLCTSLPAFSAVSDTSVLLDRIHCSGHNLTNLNSGNPASDYSIEIARSTQNSLTERDVVLYKRRGNVDDFKDKAYGCVVRGDMLTCEVGDAKVQLYMNSILRTGITTVGDSKYKSFTYYARMTVPHLVLLTKEHEAICSAVKKL